MNNYEQEFENLKELMETMSAYDFIKEAEQFRRSIEYPTTPVKPFLKKGHTSAEAQEYSKLLNTYESDMVAYRIAKDMYYDKTNPINGLIEQKLKEDSGLNKFVPEKNRDKVWSKAWADGHSSGYHEVYGHLCELVTLFIED